MNNSENCKTLLCALSLFCAATLYTSAATADVVISSKPTSNMSCSNGVCMPTAKKAVLNISDLDGMLANGVVTIKSTAQNPDIAIDTKLSWSNTSMLTLDSYHSIVFNKPVVVAGAGGMTITTNDGGTGGDFRFFGTGHVIFSDLNSSLTINGDKYSLFKSLKTLHDFVKRHFLHYALARSIKLDGIYDGPPIGGLYGQGRYPIALEGLGNTIANLTIHGQQTDEADALFPNISGVTVVRDIGLTSVNIEGYKCVAALAGILDTGAVIKFSYATGQIMGEHGATVGGLVCENQLGEISQSNASVDISVPNGAYAAGGLAGTFESSHAGVDWGVVDQSYATGAVSGGTGAMVGGLIGYNYGGDISDSYATGTVSGSSDASVGGLVGLNANAPLELSNPKISNSFSTGSVTGANRPGGFVGKDIADPGITDAYWDLDTSGIDDPSQGAGNVPNDPGVTGLSDAQLKSALPAGFDKKVWKQSPAINNGYPYLIDNPPPR